MSSTVPMQLQNIEVLQNGERIGYVAKVYGKSTMVYCNVTSHKFRFPKKKAQSVLRSAKTATIIYMEDGSKIYPKKDKITFQMVEH